MIIRETVLMPNLQYILNLVKKGVTLETIEELRQFSNYQNLPVCGEIINQIIELLICYVQDLGSAREKLENAIMTPYKCNQCMKCCHCLQYFMIELYQILYGGDKFDDLKDSIRKGNHYLMHRLPDNLYEHLDSKTTASEYYWEHCRNLRKSNSLNNRLIILKGMSSSTPAVLNSAFNTQSFHGGGIYFNWNGFGVVIDPGYHFVENMHRFGLSVLDVDAVVVTHEHIDHTNDIRILDDLSYSLLRYREKGEKEHKVRWYLDQVTYGLVKSLQKEGSGFSRKANIIYKVFPEEKVQIHCCEKDKIVLKTVPTLHEQIEGRYLNHTFAAVFELENGEEKRKIFYTSDTKYQDLLTRAAIGSDIVIANISSVYEDDLLRIKPKSTHLGYMGCYNLLKSLEEHPPSYFLLSEFWNAKTDIRFDIARYLKDEISGYRMGKLGKTSIIPADIGTQIDLMQLSIQCSVCKEYTKDFVIMRPQGEEDEIRCVCRQCFY